MRSMARRRGGGRASCGPGRSAWRRSFLRRCDARRWAAHSRRHSRAHRVTDKPLSHARIVTMSVTDNLLSHSLPCSLTHSLAHTRTRSHSHTEPHAHSHAEQPAVCMACVWAAAVGGRRLRPDACRLCHMVHMSRQAEVKRHKKRIKELLLEVSNHRANPSLPVRHVDPWIATVTQGSTASFEGAGT